MCSLMKRWIWGALIVLVLPFGSRGLQIPLVAYSQIATDSRPIPTEIPDASVEFIILTTDEVRFLEPSLDLVVSSFRKDERIVIVDYHLGKDSQDRDRIVRAGVTLQDLVCRQYSQLLGLCDPIFTSSSLVDSVSLRARESWVVNRSSQSLPDPHLPLTSAK